MSERPIMTAYDLAQGRMQLERDVDAIVRKFLRENGLDEWQVTVNWGRGSIECEGRASAVYMAFATVRV